MIRSFTLACAALALGLGPFVIPTAQAMDNSSMSKMSDDAMMHKDGKMKHEKHKNNMMGGDAMKSGDAMKGGDAMKKDNAAPAQ